MRAERLRLSTPRRPEPASREVSAGSKKRKADDGDDESRKRTRPVVDMSGGFFDEMNEANKGKVGSQIEEVAPSAAPESVEDPGLHASSTSLPSYPVPVPATATAAAINEDEWAAFERDVATPPPDPSLPSAFTAEATISAAPLTAAEIAAQSREQASQQTKEKREAEVEGEKEDAARALEEEFDEMEGLEERVARLRRMREELRVRKAKVVEENLKAEGVGEGMDERGGMGSEGGDEEESEDEEEEEGLYMWGTLGS